MTLNPTQVARELQRAASNHEGAAKDAAPVVHLVHHLRPQMGYDRMTTLEHVFTEAFARLSEAQRHGDEHGEGVDTVEVRGAAPQFSVGELDLIATALGCMAQTVEGLANDRTVAALKALQVKAASMGFLKAAGLDV